MTKTPHLVEVDYLRCIAILAVIYIHTAAALSRAGDLSSLYPVALLNTLAQFAVPLFICISGFVLFRKPVQEAKEFYRRRFLKILPPYLIFTAVYLAANTCKSWVISDIPEIPTLSDILTAYLFAESNPHMWFFLIIIELYILYPLLSWIYFRAVDRGWEVKLLFLSLILQVLWTAFSQELTFFFCGTEQTITNKLFLCMLFYFVLGMYLRQHYSMIRKVLMSLRVYLLMLLIAPVAVLQSLHLLPSGLSLLVGVGFCLALILVSFSVSLSLTRDHRWPALRTIGLYSFGIYLIHPLIQGALGYVVFPSLGIVPEMLIYYVLVFGATTVLSVATVALLRKLPGNQYLLG